MQLLILTMTHMVGAISLGIGLSQVAMIAFQFRREELLNDVFGLFPFIFLLPDTSRSEKMGCVYTAHYSSCLNPRGILL